MDRRRAFLPAFSLLLLLPIAARAQDPVRPVWSPVDGFLTEDPAAEGLTYYWYLVVGSNGADDGPAGGATAGPRIANGSGECP